MGIYARDVVRIDRRDFVRGLAGALGLVAGGPAAAAEPNAVRDIHRATRNTLFGAVGRSLWPANPPARRSKLYPGKRRIALPEATARQTRPLCDVLESFSTAERGPASDPIELAELARLLHFTNGVTGRGGGRGSEFGLRAAPSAGAQYAGEIYVAAERIKGLEVGVYYYDPTQRVLVPIRQGSAFGVVEEAVERPQDLRGAAAAILLTNVFGRYGWRYANRGYRYALIDTGHIGENLRLAARSAGLAEASTLRFQDDRLNALLGVDGRKEAVCALHFVGRPGEGPRSPAPPTRRFYERQIVAPEAVPEVSVTERYHLATGLVPGTPARPNHQREPVAKVSQRFALRGIRPKTSVEECILQRRSAHIFYDRPVPRMALDWIASAADGGSRLGAPGIELVLVVHRVVALAPGLYRFDRQKGRLVLERRDDLRGTLVRACLGQRKAGSCAVAFFLVGEIERARRAAGDRSYRDLLIESGTIGQRIYLAAEAAGLAARNLAAFRDDAVNRLLDGSERPALHLTLVGYDTPRAS